MTDVAVLQQRLAEAEAALHKLLVGAKSVSLSHDGKAVSYAMTDEGRLRAYIMELKLKISPSAPIGRRAIPVIF